MTPSFAKGFESWQSWDTNPLYALLHEPIYAQGGGVACAWAAQRVRDAHFAADFDVLALARAGKPVAFTGEMVFPWFFDDFAALRPYKAAAELLAARTQWGKLYDEKARRLGWGVLCGGLGGGFDGAWGARA